jgi:hypothetical protein
VGDAEFIFPTRSVRVNPCGLDATLMTSVSRERGERVPLRLAQDALAARVLAW